MEGYLETLKRRCGTKRIHANVVYQDYIGDREHIHMNSTQWETLTDFVKWLGREGYESQRIRLMKIMFFSETFGTLQQCVEEIIVCFL